MVDWAKLNAGKWGPLAWTNWQEHHGLPHGFYLCVTDPHSVMVTFNLCKGQKGGDLEVAAYCNPTGYRHNQGHYTLNDFLDIVDSLGELSYEEINGY